MMERVPYVHAGAVPPAEEILKQCVLKPGMEDDKTYSHLANMMVFYKKDDTEYKKSVPSRRAAIRGSPVQVVVNHFNVRDFVDLKFLGVTRDHLKDGKSAKTHASAAGMFSVCVDGIVTIIQPKGHLGKQTARLGQYVKCLDTKFEIKDKHMQGRLLEFDDSFADAIGRVVEMRTDDVDEVRVKLLPFGARTPTREEKEGSNVNVERDKNFNAGILSGIDNQVQGALKRVDEIKTEINTMIGEFNANITDTDKQDIFKAYTDVAKREINSRKARLDDLRIDVTATKTAINNARTKTEFDAAKLRVEGNKSELDTILTFVEARLETVKTAYAAQSAGASSMASTSAPMSTSAAPEASAAMDTSTSSSIQSALASSLNRDAIRKKRGMDKPKGKEPKGKQPKRRKAMGDDAFPE